MINAQHSVNARLIRQHLHVIALTLEAPGKGAGTLSSKVQRSSHSRCSYENEWRERGDGNGAF